MGETDFPTPSTITLAALREYLGRYDSCVPEKLVDLDEARYETIPTAVKSRRTPLKGEGGVPGNKVDSASDGENSSSGYLTKEQVVQLVEWKLKHGTFRPALLGMAKAHPPDLIRSTTSTAFSQLYDDGSVKSRDGNRDPIKALKTLTTLRGIGPATASLLLSCADPDKVPFFSDELYRWMMWDEPDTAKGRGWARKIGYTDKEYTGLVEKVRACLERLRGEQGWEEGEVGAMDLEKVAYVLGRKGS